MYSQKISFCVDVSKKQILTHNVCLRYLYKSAKCCASFSTNPLNNYQEQKKSIHLVGQRNAILPHFSERQKSRLFQKTSKQLVNFQSLRNFGDNRSDLLDAPSLASVLPPKPQFEGIAKILFDSPPILYAQETLVSLHNTIGLPWWATIMLVTCTARAAVTLPLALYQQYIFAKINLLKYEMDDIVKDLKFDANTAVARMGLPESYVRDMYNKEFKKKWNELVIRDNCHPAKGLLVIFLQIPIWVLFSGGLRNLSFMLPYPTPMGFQAVSQLQTEGFGWITNLVIPDPYFILPVLMGIFNLINIEFLAAMRRQDHSKAQKIGLYISRGVMLIIVPIAALVPSSMSLYWTTSAAFGIFQNLIVYSPKVRRFARIPETEVDLDHPYKFMYNNLKKKFSFDKLNANSTIKKNVTGKKIIIKMKN